MELKEETSKFLKELESYSNRKLHYPQEVGELIELVNQNRMTEAFEDAIFHSKFVVKSQEVMRRIGPGGEGFDKMSSEFQASLEKASSLLKTIVKESPEDVKEHFVKDFFPVDEESLSRLLKLFSDLNWIKNWQVDGKPMPYESSASTASSPHPMNSFGSPTGTKRISSTAILITALLIVLVTLDPPVSTIGWLIVLVLFALVLYIFVESRSRK